MSGEPGTECELKRRIRAEVAIARLIEAAEEMFSGLKEVYRMSTDVRSCLVFRDDTYIRWQQAIADAKEHG